MNHYLATRKKRLLTIVSSFAAFVLCASPTVSWALSVDNVGESIGLSAPDFSVLLINLVNWVLGLLGIIAVAMIILGGFQWLISGGNDESVATAKKTIGNAVVGIVIILLAWAVVHFTIGTIQNASGV